MSRLDTVARRLARALLARAVRGRAERGTEWGEAMLRELDETATGREALRWAVSGLTAARRDRVARLPSTSLPRLPRPARLRTAAIGAAAVAIALTLLQQFALTMSYAGSPAMAPTVAVGDRLLVDRLGYRLSGLSYGDVVLVDLAENGSRFQVVKRVVGLPGDTISCVDGQLARDGAAVTDEYLHDGAGQCPTVIVPPDGLYLVGDALEVSRDSRHYGPVARTGVVGRVVATVWPLA